jgi:hypothetical protein
MSPLKFVAFVTGSLLIASVTHNQIQAGGSVTLLSALGLGLIVGSLCVAVAHKQKQTKLMVLIIVTLLCGEGYSLASSSEKTIINRNAAVAPLAAENLLYSNALVRVTNALQIKADADKAILENAAKVGCKVSCERLLAEASANAGKQVTQARNELAKLKVPSGSAAPLASFLNLSAVTVDVVLAAMFSFASVGLGSALVSFGGSTSVTVSAQDSVARFLLDTLTPSTGDMVPAMLLESRYIAWTIQNNQRPLNYDDFKANLTALLLSSGLSVTADGIENVAIRA